MTRVVEPPGRRVSGTERPLTQVHKALVTLWLVVAVPACALLLLVAGFGVSPTSCPEAGGSYLCRWPEAQSLTLGGVALLLALCVGLAVAATTAATAGRRRGRTLGLLAGSVAAVVLACTAIQLAASSWT